MNIIQPYAKIITVKDKEEGINLLRHIEFCARISHRSEEAQTEDSWRRFLTSVVINHGDFSVIEHSLVTVEFYFDRAVGEEQIRHRLFSPTKESTRFVNYEKKLGFSVVYPRKKDLEIDEDWLNAISTCEKVYAKLIAKDWKPEDARSVIPLGFASKTLVSGNLRNWRHFFLMRTTKETHHQLREICANLLLEFQEKIPLIFDDIVVGSLQRENLQKAR